MLCFNFFCTAPPKVDVLRWSSWWCPKIKLLDSNTRVSVRRDSVYERDQQPLGTASFYTPTEQHTASPPSPRSSYEELRRTRRTGGGQGGRGEGNALRPVTPPTTPLRVAAAHLCTPDIRHIPQKKKTVVFRPLTAYPDKLELVKKKLADTPYEGPRRPLEEHASLSLSLSSLLHILTPQKNNAHSHSHSQGVICPLWTPEEIPARKVPGPSGLTTTPKATDRKAWTG